MPTYQYACTNPDCGERFELVQAFSDDPVSECPTCGAAVRKLFGSVGVVFKGSGFYRTDSRSEAKSTAGTSSKSKSNGGSSGGSASGSSDSGSSGSGSSGSSSSGSDSAKSSSPGGPSGAAAAASA